MNPKIPKDINLYGLLIWLVLFWILIPFRLVKQYPIILVGYVYTIVILIINYLFIGNDDISVQEEEDFKDKPFVSKLLNDKATEISTAIFALAVATNTLFKNLFYKDLLLLITYTLIFGVGFILPIYFISNIKDANKVKEMNIILMRIRNVSLSYCVGFLVCGLMITIHRLFQLKK